MARMKTNQDGGSYTAKDPGAAAKELKKNEDSVAKMGYNQKFGATRMSPSKMGDMKASELMHGAARYYDGAGQYMNGAPKYEGAGKYEGPMDNHPGDDDDSMFRAPDVTIGRKVLRPEDFYDKPAAERVRSTLAAESTDPITDAPSPIQIDEHGYSTHSDEGRREAQNLSLGLREVSRRPITAQETKFEEQFGLRKFDNLKPFLDNQPSIDFAKSRPRSESSAEMYEAWRKGPVAQRYQENLNIANQQLEQEKGFTIKGQGSTIKSVQGQLQDSANNAMAQLQKKVAGFNAVRNMNTPKPKKKKHKAPYSLASVAIQALKVPFTRRAFGARQGAINEIKRKANLTTYGKMRLF